MNGYNTGWKFDGWYDYAQTTAVTTTGNIMSRTINGVTTSATLPFLGADGNSPNIAYGTQILVHGYNSVRLRFGAYAATASNTVGVMSVLIYLLESNNEEDQTAQFWMATPHSAYFVNFPTAIGVAAGQYSTSKTSVQRIAGNPYAVMAHQIRAINLPSWNQAEAAVDNDEQENWASSYFFNAVGLDLKNGQATIIQTSGLPDVTNIVNRRFTCPVYTPGNGTATETQNSSGEIYINNLAGAARMLVIPYISFPAQAIARTGAPIASAVQTEAKQVGIFYNLLQ